MDARTFEYLQRLKRDGEIKGDKLSDVPIQVGLPGGKDFPLKGALDSIDRTPDAKTKRVRFEAVVQNDKGALTPALLAGGEEQKRVRVRLTLGPPRKVLLVPERDVPLGGRMF